MPADVKGTVAFVNMCITHAYLYMKNESSVSVKVSIDLLWCATVPVLVEQRFWLFSETYVVIISVPLMQKNTYQSNNDI